MAAITGFPRAGVPRTFGVAWSIMVREAIERGDVAWIEAEFATRPLTKVSFADPNPSGITIETTPLHLAALAGNVAIVEKFLTLKGASECLGSRDSDGRSVLACAQISQCSQVIDRITAAINNP